jgi:hypothetical protein
MSRTLRLLAFSILFCAAIPKAHADSLTFVISDVATGMIGSQSFTDKLVTLSATLPLDDLANVPGYYNGTDDFEYDNSAGLITTISIQGIGTFAGASNYIVGYDTFGDGGLAIGDVNNELYLDYGGPLTLGPTFEQTPSTGPVAGSIDTAPLGSDCVPNIEHQTCPNTFDTSGGMVSFDSISPTGSAELIATPTVPEPSTFMLLGTGLVGAFGVMRRKFIQHRRLD